MLEVTRVRGIRHVQIIITFGELSRDFYVPAYVKHERNIEKETLSRSPQGDEKM